MLTWETQRPNSCGSSRKEALPGPGKHSFDLHPQTQETGQFLAERFLSKTLGINFVAGVSPGWRLQRRMLACGRLCPTTSQRSRSRSSRRPWTEPSRFGLPSISSQMNEGKKDKSVWPAQWLASPSCGRPAPNLSPVCQVWIFSEICVEKYVHTKIWWEYSPHCCQKWTCQRPSQSCSQLSRCSTRWTWRTILLAIHLTTFNSHKRKLTVFGLGHKEWLLEPFRHLITVIKTKREFNMVMPGQFRALAMFVMYFFIHFWGGWVLYNVFFVQLHVIVQLYAFLLYYWLKAN